MTARVYVNLTESIDPKPGCRKKSQGSNSFQLIQHADETKRHTRLSAIEKHELCVWYLYLHIHVYTVCMYIMYVYHIDMCL